MSGGPPVRVAGIPGGSAGIDAIIREMARVTLLAYRDERINQLARQITAGCPARDWQCEANALLGWMQRTFRYTRLPWHPEGLQRVQTPAWTLFDAPVRSGECASLSAALAALYMSMGSPVRFRVGFTAANDFRAHVWVMLELPGGEWVAADPSYDEPLGWQHPSTATVRDWDLR